MSLGDLKREVANGWSDVPAAKVALNIIDFMSQLNDQELRMLTIPRLLEATGFERIGQEFLSAIAILVSSTIHVLDAKAFFVEEDGSEVHINTQELAKARRHGSLEHPLTGKLILDYENRIIPYFGSSQRFFDARSDG